MSWTNIIQTMINDRSDIDQVICITPVGHKDNKTDKPISWTRLEDIRRTGYVGRTDLAMVNFWGAQSQLVQQVCVYGNRDGTIEWNDMEGYFTKAERKEVKAIVDRILKHGKQFPEMLGYLNKVR